MLPTRGTGQVLLTIAKTDGPWEVRSAHVRRPHRLHPPGRDGAAEQVEPSFVRRRPATTSRRSGPSFAKLSPEERNKRLREITGDKDIDDRLQVSFILASEPGTTYYGRVREIDDSAEPRGDEGVTVLMRVDFDKDEVRSRASPAGDLGDGQGGLRAAVVGLRAVPRPGGLGTEDVVPVFLEAVGYPKRTVGRRPALAAPATEDETSKSECPKRRQKTV